LQPLEEAFLLPVKQQLQLHSIMGNLKTEERLMILWVVELALVAL